MNKKFEELKEKYLVLMKDKKSSEEEREHTIQEIRKNLIERNGGCEIYNSPYNEVYKNINIKEASFTELKGINGDLNIKECSEKITEQSDSEREKQLGRNKYTEENPYVK